MNDYKFWKFFIYGAIITGILLYFLAWHIRSQYAWYPHEYPSLTPSPADELCEGGDAVSVLQICPTMEPTPTATSEATPTQIQRNESLPTVTDISYHQTTCDGIYPDKPLVQGFEVIDETTDKYSWWPAQNADKQAVVFGYAPDQLTMGQDNLPSTQGSIVLTNLKPNTQTWVQVWAFKGQCVTKSDIVN